MSLRLNTFGGLRLTRSDGDLRGAGQQKRRLALLAVLAVAGERGVTRAKLLGLLWPDVDEPRGRQALSQALYALRQDCGGASLTEGGEDLRLDARVLPSDVELLIAAVAAGDDQAVADLHTGPFLDGVYLNDAPDFERWVEDQRARYASVAQQSLERLAVTADAAGDHAAAVRWWQRLAALDPLRTIGAVGLVSALARSGERTSAIRYAERYARLVREELDVEPSDDVTTLVERLRVVPDEPPLASAFAGRYRIEREIGRGGMAVVFLARDVKHDRAVAIKMLHPELSAAIGAERLAREILVTANLRHPHILPLFDSGEMDGTLYYVMPFVEGETLRERLVRDGPLPPALVTHLVGEIAEALQHAHQRGVIHRDIKPENVLLSEGHASVMDFGIAHTTRAPGEQTLTQHGHAVGTPAYMSPEQATGDADIDARSDIFSLACIAFEMFTGRPPWIGATVQATLAKRFVEDPPSVAHLRPELPDALNVELARALSTDPAARHETARALADAIARALADRDALESSSFPSEPPGELIGRDRELSALAALALRADIRLITLTGSGGSGKTRLALRLVSNIGAHFESAQFVDLSAITDPLLALPTIASAVGARDAEGRSTLETLVRVVGARRMILVLDNLEQITAAAPDIAKLIASCPKMTVLATSRAPLRVRGEHEFFVAPLAVPDGVGTVTAESSPAVRLFVQRATEAKSDFSPDDDYAAIVEICRRLDGLPLAIELAAARCRLLSPRNLLSRLDQRFDVLTGGARDLPSRQRTLEATIAWSYDLLGPRERVVFAQLAVFAGGASLNAAAAVVACSEIELLELAQILVDASLLRQRGDDDDGQPRFFMLESVREFGRARLRESPDSDEVWARHRTHFRLLAVGLSTASEGESSAAALVITHREHDNLGLALDGAHRAGDAPALAELVLALWRTWLVRGRWTEGREWIARALALGAALPPEVRARLHAAASTLAQNQGDYANAFLATEQALALWRAAGDRHGEASSLASMGWIDWRRCRFAEARALSLESLALHRALGDDRGAGQALNNLGWTALFVGDLASAVGALEESLAIRQRVGDRRNIAFTQTTLAWALSGLHENDQARALLEEARTTFESLGERQLLAFNMRVQAGVDLEAGNADLALGALERTSIPVFRELGDRWGLMSALTVLGDALMVGGREEEALAAHVESLEIARAINDPLGVATGLARAAEVVARVGNIDEAAALVKEVDQILVQVNAPLLHEHRERYEQLRHALETLPS
ncbi:MAG: protein kinase [Gemmatimonadota bacterium]